MILRYPWVLLLLLLVPLLAYLRYARRRKATVTFSDTQMIAHLPPSLGVMLQPLFPVLYMLALGSLVVALARPQEGLEESLVRTDAVDIVLLVDVSPSMEFQDFSTRLEQMNRLDAAKKVIERFVKKRTADRIGMVAFAALPYSVSPLTLDHGFLLQRMEQLQPGVLGDGTAIGTGIASAVNRLRESKAISKVVVLLTDGVSNAGKVSPDEAAQAAKALGIKVYAVGAGSDGVVNMPVQGFFGGTQMVPRRSEIDEATLKRIADATGARYFRATDLESLGQVYDEIDALEKTEIEVEQYTRFEDRFMPWAWFGLACLAAEKLLALSRFGRIPS